MKKKLLVISFLCLVFQQLYSLTDQEVLRGIVSNHTRALDGRNMYDKPLDPQDLRGWYKAIMDVKDFVVKNSKKKKKQLLKYFQEIETANNNLINGIKGVYGEIRMGELDRDVHKGFSKKFTSIDADMKRIQKNLDWIVSKIDVENQAIKLMRTLAQFVGVTARKANKDLDRASNNG